ncbi:putative membrane protein [Constrictibacter sp. MBR-5]|uniref:DUF4870 family protein n=1 Tax=Constrictibacter sp. MBR-5 TaxID=3156467 RepID=UPI003399F459
MTQGRIRPSVPDGGSNGGLNGGSGGGRDSRVVMAHVIYALYALGLFTVLGTAVVGVVLAYFNRDAGYGTWLAGHARWQIRTFWFGLLFYTIGAITTWILIGWPILLFTTVWFVWRIAKGWLRLAHGEPIGGAVEVS